MTTNPLRARGPHTFTPSQEEEDECALCLLCALAHAGTEDNCDECGHPVSTGQECAACLDEDETLVHATCCAGRCALRAIRASLQ